MNTMFGAPSPAQNTETPSPASDDIKPLFKIEKVVRNMEPKEHQLQTCT